MLTSHAREGVLRNAFPSVKPWHSSKRGPGWKRECLPPVSLKMNLFVLSRAKEENVLKTFTEETHSNYMLSLFIIRQCPALRGVLTSLGKRSYKYTAVGFTWAMVYSKYSWLEDGWLERSPVSHVGCPQQWQWQHSFLRGVFPHRSPAWPQGVCLVEIKLLFPQQGAEEKVPRADDLQVPRPQVQARSFPYLSLLLTVLVLNHVLPTAHCSILILVFKFDVRDHFPITDPGSSNNNSCSHPNCAAASR